MSNQYKPPSKINVWGATAPDGRPYVKVQASRKRAWIPREAFTANGGEALKILKAGQMPFLAHEWAECKKLVAELRSYPTKPLIERPGRNGRHFALIDGTVFSPTGEERPVVLFPTNRQKCASAGSIDEWRKLTAVLKDQPIATFVLLSAYAGPFLSLTNSMMNLGFELAGPGGIGKSTLQRLAAAVWGPADDPAGTNYWITANATMNGLEPVMAEHHDTALIIEEANLFAAADHLAKRAARFNELVFRLADGTVKRRFGSGHPLRSRFVFLTSTNEPLAQVLHSHRVAVGEAAADRLLTIPFDHGRPYGVFDSLPKGYRNSRALADHLSQGMRKCYGVGIRRLLRCLVEEQAKDPAAVRTRLQRAIRRFRSEVGVDENHGSETRIADAFGLVYAAGVFAVRYRAVSRHLDPLRAALACYEMNKASRAKPPSFVKQLRYLAGAWGSVEVWSERLREMTDQDVEEATAFVRMRRDRRQEILLTPRQLARAFPNQRAFFADPEIRAMMVAESGRKQTKRQIRSNRAAERFHVFVLPEGEEVS